MAAIIFSGVEQMTEIPCADKEAYLDQLLMTADNVATLLPAAINDYIACMDQYYPFPMNPPPVLPGESEMESLQADSRGSVVRKVTENRMMTACSCIRVDLQQLRTALLTLRIERQHKVKQ